MAGPQEASGYHFTNNFGSGFLVHKLWEHELLSAEDPEKMYDDFMTYNSLCWTQQKAG